MPCFQLGIRKGPSACKRARRGRGAVYSNIPNITDSLSNCGGTGPVLKYQELAIINDAVRGAESDKFELFLSFSFYLRSITLSKLDIMDIKFSGLIYCAQMYRLMYS